MDQHAHKPIACKCCSSESHYIGSLDANKCCADRIGNRILPVSQIQVPYWGCRNCGFVFTNFVDNWSNDDFRTKIYNEDYNIVNRPIIGRDNVPVKETPSYFKGKHIASLLRGSQQDIRILDYGAGGDPGPTGLALMDEGFTVHSHEPYRADTTRPLEGSYDVIVAVEVFEHCHDLNDLALFMRKHLSRDGLIWIQTLLHPHPTPPNVLDSWYIAPRDGHVSIFTLHALTVLFNRVGINIVQTALGTFGFKGIPTFPNRIFLR